MHVPPWHVVVPLTHIAPPPQVHEPDVQPSASVGSHVVHVAAPVPHAVTVGGAVQTLPVQHPVPHEVESHVQR
jgi:hypothetical protein